MKDKSNFVMLTLVLVLVVLSVVSTYVTLESSDRAPMSEEPFYSGKIGFSVKAPDTPVIQSGKLGVTVEKAEVNS